MTIEPCHRGQRQENSEENDVWRTRVQSLEGAVKEIPPKVKITAKELARASGECAQTVARWLQDERFASVQKLIFDHNKKRLAPKLCEE